MVWFHIEAIRLAFKEFFDSLTRGLEDIHAECSALGVKQAVMLKGVLESAIRSGK